MRLRPVLRRCAALALMLCLGLFWSVEVALADVHDDAPQSATSPHATAAGTSAAGAATAITLDADAGRSQQEPGAPQTHDPHSAHADHCSHAHSAPIAARVEGAPPMSLRELVPSVAERAPETRIAAPPVPPPVV